MADEQKVIPFENTEKSRVDLLSKVVNTALFHLYEITVSQLPDNAETKKIIDQLRTLTALFRDYFEKLNQDNK